MMNKRNMILDRLNTTKEVIQNLKELGISSDEISSKLIEIMNESLVELKDIEKEEQQQEYENICKMRRIIDRNYLDRDIDRNMSWKLLEQIRATFRRDNAIDRGGLKQWLVYFGYICSYGEKDENGWCILNISKGDEEDDDEAI